MYVVDASVWVSRFVPTDVHYQPSHEWLGKQVELNEVIVSPAILLAEVGGAMARRSKDSILASQALDLVVRLPNVQLVSIDAALATLSAQTAVSFSLRGADSFYVALAHRLGIPLITWDREQRERSGSLISSLTPVEALAQS